MSLLTTIPNIITSAVAVDANEDFTILWILLSGILVFFMQAGFTLVESGLTRAKNAGNIAMKNFMDISVGTISFWALGYGLMYGPKGSMGIFSVSEFGLIAGELVRTMYSSKLYLLQLLLLSFLVLSQEELNTVLILFSHYS